MRLGLSLILIVGLVSAWDPWVFRNNALELILIHVSEYLEKNEGIPAEYYDQANIWVREFSGHLDKLSSENKELLLSVLEDNGDASKMLVAAWDIDVSDLNEAIEKEDTRKVKPENPLDKLQDGVGRVSKRSVGGDNY